MPASSHYVSTRVAMFHNFVNSQRQLLHVASRCVTLVARVDSSSIPATDSHVIFDTFFPFS